MTASVHPAPPFDPEVAPVLEALRGQMPPTLSPELIPLMRQAPAVPIEDLIADRPIRHEERTIPVEGGEVTVSIFTRTDHAPGSPGIFHTHGGGMIIGDRFTGAPEYLAWVDTLDVVVVSIEYRLAPEHPDPTPIDDCYAGLVRTAEHADELGFDPARLVIAGASAGGGLAAGVSLKARDEGGPALAASLLIYPMLDDRNETVSSHQIDGIGVWDRGSIDTGWDALLGDRRKTDAVSPYAAPARATDFSGLPPTFVDCATAEVFRDEDVAYASAIWAQGGIAELHVWPGGFHGFDLFVPNARISIEATAARVAWLRRVLDL
ncbi:alpha/beta hydrolase [Frondihabitans cladoniiphilus]|uniref:Alpha/beta hydrolase n=1 Tax=Frondihabitans cladoniiphilus TaxID=715785 RepID=A0ABP8VQW0_9MICO